MNLTQEFFQKFIGWQVQIMLPMNDLCYQGEVLRIEIRAPVDTDVNDWLDLFVTWMAVRENGDPWERSYYIYRGQEVDTESYSLELDNPVTQELSPGCFNMVIASAEHVVTFFRKDEVNWIDPSTLPWLKGNRA